MSKSTAKSDSIRVFNLAKELKLDNKELIDLCQALGFEKIKNQLNSLTPDEVVAVKARLNDGPAKSSSATAPSGPVRTQAAPVLKAVEQKVRTLAPSKPKPIPAASEPNRESVVEVAVEVRPDESEPAEAAPPAVEAEVPVEVEIAVEPAVPAAPTQAPRGLDNLLSPNRIPNLGARPVSGVRNLNQPRPQAPRPIPTAPIGVPPAPITPVAESPAPVDIQAEVAAVVVEENPVPLQSVPQPQVPQPQAVAVQQQPAPAPQQAQPQPPQQPQRSSMPMNSNYGRPQNLSSGTRPGGQPSGPRGGPTGPAAGPRPGPAAAPPRTNFPPPNPGAPRPNPYGPSGGPNQGGPRPPAPGAPGAPKPPTPGTGPSKSVKLTPEQIKKLRETEQKRGIKLTTDQVTRTILNDAPTGPAVPEGPRTGTDRPAGPTGPARPAAPGAKPGESEEEKRKGGAGVIGRDMRHQARQKDRRPVTDKGAVTIGAGGEVEVDERRFGSQKGPRAALMAKMKRRLSQQNAAKREGPVEIDIPITVRTLSEVIGVKLGELSKMLLKETQQLYGANSVVDFEVAELIAIEKGIKLVAKKQKSAKELLLEEFEVRANTVDPEKLRTRPPIVVIMGHVDHGKTTLLDRIREQYGLASDVVSTEAGGITQVLRAWRVEKDGKPVTFLDTPGHEAFTKMRARGANVTDIAVIVVAATDGVMPQTEEAIAHARAAEVDIIVAINKVDMPNANLDRTRRQLYTLNLLPDDMGGDIQFVETSAVTGQGIGELLDAIGLQAELSDPPLLADPEHPASGTCLEAYLDGDRGVMATLLVQQGTLHKGDVILCGATHGRVRAMFDDLGRPIDEAGPSTPVKVFGLSDVPDADDPFYFVDDITRAAEIAEKERQIMVEQDRMKFVPVSLDRLREANSKIKITELKVILKAEARGSVEAIKKELEKLVHEEVRCRVLHAGIGAMSESDITLALTSPQDTLVIGFNVTADDAALKMAEARGISLREYQIIYNLVDDVKAALEGRLKPIEEVVHLGRAVIRETFKISKVGTIAGCYVTSGVLERSARVRIIREGTVVYPPPGKSLGLDSLKRFKDDAKEVREGFECGLKITGFDDIKVGDVIEAYRIDIKTRTL